MKKIFTITTTILLLVIIFLGNYAYKKNEMLKSVNSNLASTTIAYDQKIEQLTKEKTEIINALNSEKNINTEFGTKIKEISNTVGDLEKLKSLDKELLQKYSKVFFLNEHYTPKRLLFINENFIVNGRSPQKFHAQALPFLESMIKDAKADGVNLRVISSYRSFSEQASLKNNYKIIYGAGTANQFSADQGYSEHQLGTTVDLSTAELGTNYEKIATDKAYEWLSKNAHFYGFILSYPKNNKYYIYEPWHWRFVGTDLARYLKRNDLNFYDMEQRDIDTYLLHIFD